MDESIARRSALDHLLGIVANAECGENLVLRGSMTMLAWVGEAARPPGDLDWIVRPLAGVPLDDLHPYPFLNRLDPVQTWPEVAHGAGRNQLWTFEDFDTGGLSPRLPPDGLRWVAAEETAETNRPHQDILDLVSAHPTTSDGVILDADAIIEDDRFAYAYREDGDGYPGARGARVLVPWSVHDGPSGVVQLDFAYDEALPEAPLLTAVPRQDGEPPTAVWSASVPLSLAWKLQWLATDQVTRGRSAGKDLYDAVLLAELGLPLSARLRRTIARRVPDPAVLHDIRRWTIDWSTLDGEPEPWLVRLAAATDRLL